MSTVKQLEQIAYSLREVALRRWTDHKILDHISVKLPAPIFDQVDMDMRAELPSTADISHGFTRDGAHFMFAGIKFERVNGEYWSLPRL